MRGLTAGEASSVTTPLLQLFCRSGGFLADFVSGTYKIDYIGDPSVAPTAKVALTAFAAGDKVATGRYAIPTGDTSAWTVGTHRAVCMYQMEAGGPTYPQILEFEILDSGDFPTGANYTGYISVRRAIQDEYVMTTDATATVQRYICRASQQVEVWTRRWFEPRYVVMKVAGTERSQLLLREAIIAIEDVYAIWQTTTGQDTYKFEQYLYKVYNRQLDGPAELDDRWNPLLYLTDVDGTIPRVEGFAWPYGNQNIQIQGVFGFTDPQHDPHAGEVLIGETPRPIAQVVGALVNRYLEDPMLSSAMVHQPGTISMAKTRDQSYRRGGGGGTTETSNMSGDPILDQILQRYCAPLAVGAM